MLFLPGAAMLPQSSSFTQITNKVLQSTLQRPCTPETGNTQWGWQERLVTLNTDEKLGLQEVWWDCPNITSRLVIKPTLPSVPWHGSLPPLSQNHGPSHSARGLPSHVLREKYTEVFSGEKKHVSSYTYLINRYWIIGKWTWTKEVVSHALF